MDHPKIFHAFGFVVWTSLWFSVVYFSSNFCSFGGTSMFKILLIIAFSANVIKNWQNLGWKNWFYCKLLMTFCCWFCAITAVYFSSFGWSHLWLGVTYAYSILLSLPRPSKTDCFTITDRDRMTICWVYSYNNLSAKMQGLF